MSKYAEHIRTAGMTFDLTRIFLAGSWITHIQQWNKCVLAISLDIKLDVRYFGR